MINIIVAYSKNHVIGREGNIPWHISDDLKRFKSLTTGHPIIMGRKTHESIGKPLPNRENIVVSRNKNYSKPGIKTAGSFKEAISLAKKSDDEIFVIGGGNIYKQAMKLADKIIATVVDKEIEGDAYFPKVDLNNWRLDQLEKRQDQKSKQTFRYATFVRRARPPKLYHIDAGRTLEQIFQMEDLEERSVCIFCPEHFKFEHREPIEIETKHWLVTKNDYPYEHTSLHLLFIAKKHVSLLSELSSEARQDLTDLLCKIEKKYKLTSYGQFMRAGDFRYNGSSIEHLHGHIIVGDTKHPEFKSIKVKLGSKPNF